MWLLVCRVASLLAMTVEGLLLSARHCERQRSNPEASFVLDGLPRRLRLLAMTVDGAPLTPYLPATSISG